jgi:hypothetical protein
MATRATAFGRTMAYFREANLDEALAAINSAARIMDERQAAERPRAKVTRKPRKAKVAQAAEQAAVAGA